MIFFRKISLGFLFFIWVIPATSAGNGKDTPQFIEGTVRVSAEEIVALVEKHNSLVLIDSRRQNEVKRGYIEGSINLVYTDTYGSSLASHIQSAQTPVVFYCSNIKCDQSVKAAKIAAAEGYSNVYWFRGGIQEWKNKGLPLVRP